MQVVKLSSLYATCEEHGGVHYMIALCRCQKCRRLVCNQCVKQGICKACQGQ